MKKTMAELKARSCEGCGVPMKRKRMENGKLETRLMFEYRTECRMCMSGAVVCSTYGCTGKPHSKGMCARCYHRNYTYGHPEAVSMMCAPNKNRVWLPMHPPKEVRP